MNIPRKERFEHNDNSFDIVVAGQNDRFTVHVELDGNQVSPVYSVSIETHQDYFMQHRDSLVEHLVSIAKSDVEQGMYFKGVKRVAV